MVVSNTNPNLTNTDTANDGETTIAINPANPDEIVISAFSGGWGANAPIYHSTDGGLTWTREFSVPVPPGWPSGCPCDWAFDYGRDNLLSGTILASSPTVAGGVDVVSGTTNNPALSASWGYFDPAGAPVQAQETNINWAGSIGNADQPWLLANRDPTPRRRTTCTWPTMTSTTPTAWTGSICGWRFPTARIRRTSLLTSPRAIPGCG